MPAAAAAAAMSASLFCVMTPRDCSLLTWSSTWGMTALTAVLTRGVATYKRKEFKILRVFMRMVQSIDVQAGHLSLQLWSDARFDVMWRHSKNSAITLLLNK